MNIPVESDFAGTINLPSSSSNTAALSTVLVEVVPTDIILPPALITEFIISAFSSSMEYSSKCIW